MVQIATLAREGRVGTLRAGGTSSVSPSSKTRPRGGVAEAQSTLSALAAEARLEATSATVFLGARGSDAAFSAFFLRRRRFRYQVLTWCEEGRRGRGNARQRPSVSGEVWPRVAVIVPCAREFRS